LEIEKDDIPFASVVLMEFNVLHSPPTEVTGLHVIFDLNGVLVAKWVRVFYTLMVPSSSLILKPRLKDFLTTCLV
jgi:hypothetical protein